MGLKLTWLDKGTKRHFTGATTAGKERTLQSEIYHWRKEVVLHAVRPQHVAKRRVRSKSKESVQFQRMVQ